MKKSQIPRLDTSPEYRSQLLPFCRLKRGEVWEDKERGHRVAVADATDEKDIEALCDETPISLFINDPPYNITPASRGTDALPRNSISDYVEWSRRWVNASVLHMAENGYFYVWLGADQDRGFQPLPDFMIMMRDLQDLRPRSFITMRNQRGYGTQSNWMFVRQELLCYIRGTPDFSVTYTDIPKILRGYYKTVGGQQTENLERSKSRNIRPGNVWVDIQQVFYRMEENVPGAYAQKPLKAIERIIETSSGQDDIIADFFCHSGTTLIAADRLGRRCFTGDIDPIFAEMTIRRLEHYRETGRTGWQTENPFPEVSLEKV